MTHSPFSDKRDAVIKEARSAGVRIIIDSVTDPSLWEGEVHREEEGVYVSLGIHPQSVTEGDFSKELRLLGLLAGNPKTAALGEIGLDTLKNITDKETQMKIFLEQIEIAVSERISVIIHCLGQYDLLLKALKNTKPAVPVILHRYSGGDGQVGAFSTLGCFFSISGNILNPEGKKLAKSVMRMPNELIVAETDAPYFYIGEKREIGSPAHLPLVIEAISKIKGEDYHGMKQKIYENSKRAFPERISFPD
ncbi:TatD family hydrolase [candidate division WOR-3 bacterium]|nr:TatD family hydrolase [candidate division WOR-3 bacterium]